MSDKKLDEISAARIPELLDRELRSNVNSNNNYLEQEEAEIFENVRYALEQEELI